MDCRKTTEIMSRLMEGPLTDADQQFVAAHIAECSSCLAEYEDWKILAAELSQLPELSPAKGFVARVMEAIDPSYYRRPAKEYSSGSGLILAGLLGLAGLLSVDAALHVQQMIQGWFYETTIYQALQAVYETVFLRGILRMALTGRGPIGWLQLFQADQHWWFALGTFNLLMMLVLIKFALDRVLATGRGGTR